jgi:hypothetical protein
MHYSRWQKRGTIADPARPPRPPCSVEGCDRQAVKRGWCDRHYRRWQKHGDPLAMVQPAPIPGRHCSIDGCDRPHAGRGWCKLHLARWQHHGTTDLLPQPSFEDAFWAKVDRRGPDDCWPWTGSTNNRGYGVHMVKDRAYAHRRAWTLTNGAIPAGLFIDHTCHNRDKSCAGGWTCPHRRCCNPSHLEPVTGRVNVLRADTLPARNVAKTHCPKGHPLDGLTMKKGKGRRYPTRYCTTCAREYQRRGRSSSKRG